LLTDLGLWPQLAAQLPAQVQPFAPRVPRSFVRRMRYGDAADPLLRQVLPLALEHVADVPGFVADPLFENAAQRVPGLLQKYSGRALLITTGACAVHCRYCFRREYPYAEQADDTGRWQQAIAALRADVSLEELILSGGDPWVLSNDRLQHLSSQLTSVAHLRRLRIHTRLPVVLPARVDTGLCRWLALLPWPTVVVLHCNHAQEIDAEVRAACQRLRASGIQLLNQAVLLAGVNDSWTAQRDLSMSLFDAGVLPYYLHLLDPVRGTAHFAVEETRARRLHNELAAALPGYLLPRLVREIPNRPAKTVISGGWES
jgi:EF-P beta-lysylation protein EpmB